MIADEILTSVQQAADLRNLDVMRLAWRRVGIRCANCNFPENAERFIIFLQQYVDARLNQHHAIRRWDRDAEDGVSSCRTYQAIVEWTDKANILRRHLIAIWPCEECVLRFNPTYKSMFRGVPLYGRAMPKLRQGDLFDE